MKLLLIFKKISLARYINFIIILVVVYIAFYNKYWEQKDGIIRCDVIDYYGYLPATVIYKDVTCKFLNNPPNDYTGIIWAYNTSSDYFVMKMTMGMSILYSPFFFIAHGLAKPLGYKPDGYILPYRFAIAMSCIIYLTIGLYYLRKILERFFNPLVIGITLFSTVICTNLIFYTIRDAGMTHVYNFVLFSVFLFFVIKWHEKQNILYSLLIGMLGGLITLIRPSNIIIFLIFFLYGCISITDIKIRLQLFIRSYKMVLLILFTAFLICLPQLIYWHTITGKYFYFSYIKNEHFFFNNPRIIRGLFGYRNGWLLYTPIMILALTGISLMRDKLKLFRLPLIIFVVFNIYIILSWWCWWYAGCGHRAFIDSYALLSVPLATFIQWTIFNKRKILKILFICLIVIFNFFGVYHTLKFHYGSFHHSGMTKESYWQSFGKLRPDGNFKYLLKETDPEKAQQGLD